MGDAGQGLTRADRRRIRVVGVVSLTMLVGSVALRALAPSPLAPRVHVRWTDGITDSQRTALEGRFALEEGQHREDTTWAYDLTELSPAALLAFIRDPAVAGTHYIDEFGGYWVVIDRVTGEVAADAPRGTTRLGDRWASGWIHSALFEWFILFWVSSVVVSGVWLASATHAHRK
jgi:hypothetical protein